MEHELYPDVIRTVFRLGLEWTIYIVTVHMCHMRGTLRPASRFTTYFVLARRQTDTVVEVAVEVAV